MDMYKVDRLRQFGRFVGVEQPLPDHLAHGVDDPFMARVGFANGYTDSVVRHRISYGGDEGLLELAVMVDGELVYDTPITSDVESFLTVPEVVALLERIEALTR